VINNAVGVAISPGGRAHVTNVIFSFILVFGSQFNAGGNVAVRHLKQLIRPGRQL
jgi:hypothetical protein